MKGLLASLPSAGELPGWADVVPFIPALVLVLGGSLLVLLEVSTRTERRGYMPWLTAATAVLAGLFVIRPIDGPLLLFGGAAVLDDFAVFISVVVCASLALSALVSSDYLRGLCIERGEYYGLLCFAAAGMLMLAVSSDLITLFVSLALMSVSTYALIAFRRGSDRSVEAAYKYLVLSGFSAAIFLYGASLLFTATGELGFAAIAQHAAAPTPLFLVGSGLVTVGFAFKLAAVPFHLWAPDVYEGAPTPVVAFLAAGVKAAVFAALVRLLLMALGDPAVARSGIGWGHLIFAFCLLSMVVGNVMALLQDNVKRMLGFSWIAHAGYVFLGVTAAAWGRPEVIDSVAIYLLAYGISAVGAFAVVGAVEHRRRLEGEDASGHIDELAGLSKRSPAMAFAMAVFMLSLAGIPPTVGFFAKLEVLRVVFAAAQADPGMAIWLYGLVVMGIVTSVIGLYYYLRVIVAMYMREEQGKDTAAAEPEKAGAGVSSASPRAVYSSALRLGVAAAALAVILLGALPGPLSSWAKGAVRASFGEDVQVSSAQLLSSGQPEE